MYARDYYIFATFLSSLFIYSMSRNDIFFFITSNFCNIVYILVFFYYNSFVNRSISFYFTPKSLLFSSFSFTKLFKVRLIFYSLFKFSPFNCIKVYDAKSLSSNNYIRDSNYIILFILS
jgi:hypothetical protein